MKHSFLGGGHTTHLPDLDSPVDSEGLPSIWIEYDVCTCMNCGRKLLSETDRYTDPDSGRVETWTSTYGEALKNPVNKGLLDTCIPGEVIVWAVMAS